MADQKTYRAVVPLEPDTDLDVARWLVRESFELTAAAAGLTIVDYHDDAIVSADQIPKANGRHLAHPIDHYSWREFVGVAQRPPRPETDPVCGYCQHPPHTGECTGDCPPWWPEPSGNCGCPGPVGVK